MDGEEHAYRADDQSQDQGNFPGGVFPKFHQEQNSGKNNERHGFPQQAGIDSLHFIIKICQYLAAIGVEKVYVGNKAKRVNQQQNPADQKEKQADTLNGKPSWIQHFHSPYLDTRS